MVPMDLLNVGLPQTFNLSKPQYMQSAIKRNNKTGMTVYFMDTGGQNKILCVPERIKMIS